MWNGNWASGRLSAAMVQILIQEQLGFHVRTAEGPGLFLLGAVLKTRLNHSATKTGNICHYFSWFLVFSRFMIVRNLPSIISPLLGDLMLSIGFMEDWS